MARVQTARDVMHGRNIAQVRRDLARRMRAQRDQRAQRAMFRELYQHLDSVRARAHVCTCIPLPS